MMELLIVKTQENDHLKLNMYISIRKRDETCVDFSIDTLF